MPEKIFKVKWKEHLHPHTGMLIMDLVKKALPVFEVSELPQPSQDIACCSICKKPLIKDKAKETWICDKCFDPSQEYCECKEPNWVGSGYEAGIDCMKCKKPVNPKLYKPIKPQQAPDVPEELYYTHGNLNNIIHTINECVKNIRYLRRKGE